ncbi:hypothetical protein E2C01_034856 [Portunus trituberculatus]|uniref:Uncharacterized protein n=1 Tax=Portunus trituberculatus TaxID=210409 RepID=A0A5B7F825_PORTR|nr:hypothetical protein [Portunus trituberculatus]
MRYTRLGIFSFFLFLIYWQLPFLLHLRKRRRHFLVLNKGVHNHRFDSASTLKTGGEAATTQHPSPQSYSLRESLVWPGAGTPTDSMDYYPASTTVRPFVFVCLRPTNRLTYCLPEFPSPHLPTSWSPTCPTCLTCPHASLPRTNDAHLPLWVPARVPT